MVTVMAVVPDLALCNPPTSISSPSIALREVPVSDFDLKGVPPDQRVAALFVTSTLRTLAREEVLGRRTPRLLEPGLAMPRLFRGRMDERDLHLAEDGAVKQPLAFRARAILARAEGNMGCLLYTSPSPRDRTRSRMPSSA